ncbi:DUF4435 domain-containing protein [Leptospira interrogans]|nr:AAA family ATPase [Leptospira interrogans]
MFDELYKYIDNHIKNITLIDASNELIEIYNNLKKIMLLIDSNIDETTHNVYLDFYKNISEELLTLLANSSIGYTSIISTKIEKINYFKVRDLLKSTLIHYLSRLNFTNTFFTSTDYFSKNVVCIGANGSGKSRLSTKFKEFIKKKGVVISAQRILYTPIISNITNPENSFKQLESFQNMDKSNSYENLTQQLQQEFKVILEHLVSENIKYNNLYTLDAHVSSSNETPILPPQTTNLNKLIKIWNELITHISISCEDGMNILPSANGIKYPLYRLSDGEKVLIFLIGQVLLAPENGFIIVDEPEMYLHKSILIKLWDKLEYERKDCLFIYLTHDLDFATSRTNATKLWIKSFQHPDNWEFQILPSNEIPEVLLMELLGSRKNILFCEGLKGSIDERIYNILFPKLTVIAVSSCLDVINFTKAFNKLPNITIKAYGIIDSDFHSQERIDSLLKDMIYSISVSEVENLLLDLDLLKNIIKIFHQEEKTLEKIKVDILNDLQDSKSLQASLHTSFKLNLYFSESNISKGNNLDNLKSNYHEFINSVKIESWYNDRIEYINDIIANKDYNSVLKIYNNKGLKRHVNKNLRIYDYTEYCLKYLNSSPERKNPLLKYFHNDLIEYV